MSMTRPYQNLLFCCYLIICIPLFCVCYEIEVKIISDDNVVEEFVYNWKTEEPPFYQNTWESPNHFNDGTEDTIRTNRMKRQQQMIVNRNDSDCLNNLLKMRQATENKPVQLAITMEIGATVTMICHFCGDSQADIYGPATWFKLNHHGTSDYYGLNEVEIDMHDEELENRVTMTVDHSLAINSITDTDIGSYFCRMGSVEDDRYVKEQMSMADISAFLTATDRFRFIYHLDILLPSDEPVIEVSRDINDFQQPSEDVNIEGLNVNIITEWKAWGPCSVCGQPGERKRLGTCAIQKLDYSKAAQPWYMNAILTSYYGGVPCRSRLFASHPGIETRPDEIELEACDIQCRHNSMKKGKTLSAKGLGKLSFGGRDDRQAISQTLMKEISTGEHFEISCPGAAIDTVVNWVIGSKYYSSYKLKNATKGRVEVNIFSKLIIHRADIGDSGKYTCWYNGKQQLTFQLMVIARQDNDAKQYFSYLLLSHVINFSVFLLFMVVKHKQRMVQVKNVQRRQSTQGFQKSVHDDANQNSSGLRNKTTQSARHEIQNEVDSDFLYEDDMASFDESDESR